MSIRIQVRKADGARVSDESLPYHRIVGWELRDQYPMLGYTDATGDMILNSLQVEKLIREIDQILVMVKENGVVEVLRRLQASEEDDFTVPGWNAERDLEPMLLDLRDLCMSIRPGDRKFLWFLGD